MLQHRAPPRQTVLFFIVPWWAIAACSASHDADPGPAVLLDAAQPSGVPTEPMPLPADAGAGRRSVTIRFRAVVGAERFACGATYVDAAGTGFTPADLRAFVQDVALLARDGAEQPLALDIRAPWQQASVALLDFEDGSGACGAGTRDVNVEVSGTLPAGDYRGLLLSNGVPEPLNHADPAGLPPPLQAGSMSWGWLLGYRFLMAEVVALPGGDAAAAGSALLHLGSSACAGNPSAGGIHCGKQNRNRVLLPDFDPDSDAVVIDLGQLLSGVDLTRVTTCHSSGPECAPFFASVGVALDTGSSTPAQALYRVEPLDPGSP